MDICTDNIKIKAWIARDNSEFRHDKIHLFFEKPKRDGCGGWKSNLTQIELPNYKFRELKWIDDPIFVELTITENNK
jgi:hypothetical protein